jgi:hypothetical protein
MAADTKRIHLFSPKNTAPEAESLIPIPVALHVSHTHKQTDIKLSCFFFFFLIIIIIIKDGVENEEGMGGGGGWLFGYVESALNLKPNPKLRIGGSREREREQYVIIISILKNFDPSLTRTLYLRVFFLDMLLESKQIDVTDF